MSEQYYIQLTLTSESQDRLAQSLAAVVGDYLDGYRWYTKNYYHITIATPFKATQELVKEIVEQLRTLKPPDSLFLKLDTRLWFFPPVGKKYVILANVNGLDSFINSLKALAIPEIRIEEGFKAHITLARWKGDNKLAPDFVPTPTIEGCNEIEIKPEIQIIERESKTLAYTLSLSESFFDGESARKYYRLLGHEHETEIRIILPDGTAKSFFTHSEDEFITKCREWDGRAQIYAGVNERRKGGTKNEDVEVLRTFFFDIDPKRPKDVASTIEQKTTAYNLTFDVNLWLKKRGYENVTSADSGNGYHSLISLEPIHVTDENRERVKAQWGKFGKEILGEFDGKNGCKIDSTFDLARISKVIGTASIKGEPRRTKFEKYNTEPNKGLREYILSLNVEESQPQKIEHTAGDKNIEDFQRLLAKDDKLKWLYEGEYLKTKYKSRSEAEFALLCKLDFYGFDKTAAFQIMGGCKIGKWRERPDSYRNKSWENAMDFNLRLLERVAGFEGKYNDPDVESLAILQDPKLLEHLLAETEKNIVGEKETVKATLIPACVTFVENAEATSSNLALNSESGAGKDWVADNTLNLFPDSILVKRSRISEKALTYWHNKKFEKDWTWKGKILYLEDVSNSVLNSDVFKTMSSGGSHSTVVINQMAIDIEIDGKPAMIITSASANPHKELLRRFPIVPLDETIDQTKAIIKRQAKRAMEGT